MLDMPSTDLHMMGKRVDQSPFECAADDTRFNQKRLTGRRISSHLKERSLPDLYDPSLQLWAMPKKYSTLGKRSDIYQGCPKSRLSKSPLHALPINFVAVSHCSLSSQLYGRRSRLYVHGGIPRDSERQNTNDQRLEHSIECVRTHI